MEGVNPIVARFPIASVVNAATGHDGDIRPFADVKIVIHQILQTGLAEQNRDVHAFVFGAGLDININAGFIRLGDNVNVFRGAPTGTTTVGANVVRALRHFVQTGDLF